MEGRGERGRRKGEKGGKGVGKEGKRREEEGKERNGREGKLDRDARLKEIFFVFLLQIGST